MKIIYTKHALEKFKEMDEKHILRIVLDRKDDIIKVITFHIGRRGKYESTL